MYKRQAQAGVLGLDGDGATLSLGGSSEGTEAAAEQSDESTGVESGPSGESTTKEKPEDRGQELQVSWSFHCLCIGPSCVYPQSCSSARTFSCNMSIGKRH